MPPKKQDKSAVKAKAKQADDKTFGLKNKNKSAKVQKFVQQVKEQAVQQHGAKKDVGPSKKEREAMRQEELLEMHKPVQIQKIPFGVDPKTVVCQFFKAGLCTKGKSCKFSHDLALDRKAVKIDLYTDARVEGQKEGVETAGEMEDWDQAKLEDVVKRKHGKQPPTDIVCKFFLTAVEDRKYGWFWQCPNGDDCKYKHALPPGFVLREKGAKKRQADEPLQTLEEWIEEQRRLMPKTSTPVTLESFNAWKHRRELIKAEEEAAAAKEREAAVKAGRSIGASGRELFTYNPDFFNQGDDDEALDYDYTQRENQDDEDQAGGINVSAFEGVSLDDLMDADEGEE